jgi:heat shock protein HtpX
MKKMLLLSCLAFVVSMSVFHVSAQLALPAITNDDAAQIVPQLNSALQNSSFLSSITGYMIADEQNMPALYQIVKNLTSKLGNPIPLVLVFKGNILHKIMEEFGEDYRVNAFAFSITKSLSLICVGQNLVEELTYDELEAVIAHELCHIDRYHVIKQWVLNSVIMYIIAVVCAGIIFPIMRHQNPAELHPAVQIAMYATPLLLTILVAYCIQRYYSRVCEKQADLGAADIIRNPVSLANALDHIEKIYKNKDRLIDFFIEMDSTHPLTKNRRRYLEALAQAAATHPQTAQVV